MLLSILANLAGLFGLVVWPLMTAQTIDVSAFSENGQIVFLERAYRAGAPYKKNNISLGVDVTAQSAIIVDKRTDFVLWQKNPAELRSLASLTKLMSALVFLDHNPGWQSVVTIQPGDYREGGRIYVYAGEQIFVSDLFQASLLASSNNATAALARSTGLSAEEFVNEMNLKAQSLGMAQSHFVEPTGLDPGNVTTANDLVKLIKVAFAQAEIASATSRPEFSFDVLNAPRHYTLTNTNQLVGSYLKIEAGKTGYLDEAGYCLTSLVKGPDRQEIYVVVLGSLGEFERFQELKALAQWAFDHYYWP